MANLEPVLGGDDTIRRNFSKVEDLYTALQAARTRIAALESTPLFNQVLAAQSTASTTYVALATAGPTLTVPADGDYIVTIGAYIRSNTSTASVFMSYDIGGSGAADADGLEEDTAVANLGGNRSRAMQKTLTSGTVLVAKYRTTAGTGLFSNRWMQLVRIP